MKNEYENLEKDKYYCKHCFIEGNVVELKFDEETKLVELCKKHNKLRGNFHILVYSEKYNNFVDVRGRDPFKIPEIEKMSAINISYKCSICGKYNLKRDQNGRGRDIGYGDGEWIADCDIVDKNTNEILVYKGQKCGCNCSQEWYKNHNRSNKMRAISKKSMEKLIERDDITYECPKCGFGKSSYLLTCPECGYYPHNDFKFICKNCGGKIPNPNATCNNCGFKNERHFYCKNCKYEIKNPMSKCENCGYQEKQNFYCKNCGHKILNYNSICDNCGYQYLVEYNHICPNCNKIIINNSANFTCKCGYSNINNIYHHICDNPDCKYEEDSKNPVNNWTCPKCGWIPNNHILNYNLKYKLSYCPSCNELTPHDKNNKNKCLICTGEYVWCEHCQQWETIEKNSKPNHWLFWTAETKAWMDENIEIIAKMQKVIVGFDKLLNSSVICGVYGWFINDQPIYYGESTDILTRSYNHMMYIVEDKEYWYDIVDHLDKNTLEIRILETVDRNYPEYIDMDYNTFKRDILKPRELYYINRDKPYSQKCDGTDHIKSIEEREFKLNL